MAKSEFEVERGELLTNLTLMEDHGYGNAPRCPYCMEKHSSKIAGYADEIAAGQEGDEAEMTKLADDAKKWREQIQVLKTKPTEEEFKAIGIAARDWRRKIQGAHSHKEVHDHGHDHGHDHYVDPEPTIAQMTHEVQEMCDKAGVQCDIIGAET